MVSLSGSIISYASTSSHHPHHHYQHLRLFFGAAVFWSAFVVPALAQVGLRTSPLTAPKNKSNQGLISKWTEMGLRQKANDSLIDYKLGAIFRGVAYGISTISPSSEVEEENIHLKIPEVVAHMPDMSVASTPLEESTSNLPKRIDTMLDYDRHHNEYTRHSGYEDDHLVTQSSASHINVQESVGRPDGDSRVYNKVNKDQVINLTSEGTPGDDFATHEVIRQSVGPWGEPTPNWILAQQEWGIAWEVHVYTVATLYSLLTLFSLYCLARIHVSTHLLPRGYYITVHLLFFLATFFRSVSLFHDPYSYEGKLPTPLSYVLFHTGAPCLIGALAVLILALLRATRTNLLPSPLQTPLALAILIAFHLGLSIAADVVVGVMGATAAPLHVVVQAITAVWGATVCVSYVWVFSHVERVAVRQQGELVRMTFTRVHLEGGTVPRRLPQPSLSRAARLTLGATVTGLLLVGLQAYGMMALPGVWTHHTPQPWPWYSYQSASRLLDILMWVLIGVASALPSGTSQGKQKTKDNSDGSMKNARAISMFCKSCTSGNETNWSGGGNSMKQMDDVYPTICQTNQAVRQFTLQSGTKSVYEDASMSQQALPQRRVNTGIIPANKRRSFRKSATLHSATSDTHLLWNQSGGVPSKASSRPSSTVFNEAEFSRIRAQAEPHRDMGDGVGVSHSSSQKPNKFCDNMGNPMKTPIQRLQENGLVHEGTNENIPNKSLKRSQKNAKNANIYDEPYESGQFNHFLQNSIDSDVQSSTLKNFNVSCQSEMSTTDYSSVGAFSSNNDLEWSKYASTRSSVSAANSFDTREYNDFEVASYYHHPSSLSTTGSRNLYFTLHKLSGPRAKMLQHHIAYPQKLGGVPNKYEDHAIPQHTMEQLTALLAPQACAVSASSQSDMNVDYLTDASASHDGFQENACPSVQESESDVQSYASHHYDEVADDELSLNNSPILTTKMQNLQKEVPTLQPGTPSHRSVHDLPYRDIPPDSVAVLEYSGLTVAHQLRAGDKDNGDTNLDVLKISSSSVNDDNEVQSRAGLLSKFVGNNFSIHGHDYSPLSSEDMCISRHEDTRITTEDIPPCEMIENQQHNVRPQPRSCGHRPRRRQGRSQSGSHHYHQPSTSSTTQGPPINSNIPVKSNRVTPAHSSASHTTPSMSNDTTQTLSCIQPPQSPESSKINSPPDPQTDLPSEYIDSEVSQNSGGIRNPSTDIEYVKKTHKGGRPRYMRTDEETGL